MTDSWSKSDALSELDPAARRRVRIGGLIAALITAHLVIAPLVVPRLLDPIRDPAGPPDPRPGLPVSQPLFDFFQRTTPGRISDRIVVVAIDEPSLRHFGHWPWSRLDLNDVVDRIAAQQPAAIGFDLLLAERDSTAPDMIAERYQRFYPELPPDGLKPLHSLIDPDQVLRSTLGKSPSVLPRAGSPWDDANNPVPPFARFEGATGARITSYPKVLANIPMLENAAAGIGFVNSTPDRDGVVRNMPLVARVGGQLTPSLALEMVRIAEGEPPIRLDGVGGRLHAVHIGKHIIQTTGVGQMRMRFRDVMQSQVISPVEVVSPDFPAHALTGKIVLIGLSSAAAIDVASTPREPQMYGVYVQAQAIDAILRSGGLIRPAWGIWGEWIGGLIIVLAAIAFLPRLSLGAMSAIAGGITVAAVALSWVAFANGVLIDPAPVVAPGLVAAVTMIALMLVRVRSALAQERHEREAASQIQTGMLIPRERLKAVAAGVEVDAVLMPARTVGGDLYDAFTLDDGRLCFVVGDVTGKGLPASLFMALAKALSRSLLLRPNLDLAEAVDRINRELSADNGQDMQLSLLVGVLDLGDGRLELCCAGHENPMILDAGGRVRVLNLDGGPPLCAMEGFPYPVETYALARGETLVVFTDGVTEAQDPAHDLFGAERTVAAVGAAAGPGALSELVDGLVKAVRAFEAGGEPSDDLTVLALRRPS